MTDNTIQINEDNNYIYTAIGELQVDKSEDIEEIVWRVDSKIAEVRRTSNSTKKNLRFDYDAMGNRIAKHIYTDNQFIQLEKSTYYVRYASGNVMAVYDRIIDASEETGEFMLSERHIYGSSRIGMDVSTHVFGPEPYTSLTETTRELGHKQYEISNHLGNVLSVITDQKLPVEVGSLIVSYSAVVVTATDYSPFGVGLYGRSWSGEYRYGFNGQEYEAHVNSKSTVFSSEFWFYNSHLGRRLELDPILRPNYSPYACFRNNPLVFGDPNGLTGVPKQHTAKSGDTYSKLSKQYGVSVDDLRKWNKYGDKVIPIGAKINVSDPKKPLLLGTTGSLGGEDAECGGGICGQSQSVPEGNPKLKKQVESMQNDSDNSLMQEYKECTETVISFGNGTNVSSDMNAIFNRFESKEGGELTGLRQLERMMGLTASLSALQGKIISDFSNLMNQARGDYSLIDMKGLHAPPSFNSEAKQLFALVGGTQQTQVLLTAISIHGTEYNATLLLKISDDYGVDAADAEKGQTTMGWWSDCDDGLAAFWVLQHQRGYRPFITTFNFEINIKGTINK